MIVPESSLDPTVLVHLFHEQATGGWTGRVNRLADDRASPRLRGMPQGHRGPSGVDALTPRELEVVALLAGGERVAAIADCLHLSAHTVQNHVRNAREKLHVSNRLDLVLEVQRRGLV